METQTDVMVKTEELRIGNYVTTMDLMLNKPMPAKVASIFYDKITVNSEYTALYHTLNAIAPIPLTPEILKGAGFEQKNLTNWRKMINGWQFILGNTSKIKEPYIQGHWIVLFRFSDKDDPAALVVPKIYITYVHQLQNLHFSLTGEELPISL
jgi:hypothetical protein